MASCRCFFGAVNDFVSRCAAILLIVAGCCGRASGQEQLTGGLITSYLAGAEALGSYDVFYTVDCILVATQGFEKTFGDYAFNAELNGRVVFDRSSEKYLGVFEAVDLISSVKSKYTGTQESTTSSIELLHIDSGLAKRRQNGVFRSINDSVVDFEQLLTLTNATNLAVMPLSGDFARFDKRLPISVRMEYERMKGEHTEHLLPSGKLRSIVVTKITDADATISLTHEWDLGRMVPMWVAQVQHRPAAPDLDMMVIESEFLEIDGYHLPKTLELTKFNPMTLGETFAVFDTVKRYNFEWRHVNEEVSFPTADELNDPAFLERWLD